PGPRTALAQGGGRAPPPYAWSVSRSDRTGQVFPDPVGHVVVGTLRYRRLPPDPSPAEEPTDVPVFPFHNYLVQAVYVFALEHGRHARDVQAARGRADVSEMIISRA